MANIRDLLIGAVLSGGVTFGTTYYLGELEHQRTVAERDAALEQAAVVAEQDARRSRTWEFYRTWQSDALIAQRDALDAAVRARPGVGVDDWDSAAGASELRTAALRDVLRFYTDFGVALSADQLDFELAVSLFGPNAAWWNQRALPSLCHGYEIGGNDRFDIMLYTVAVISGSRNSACPADPRVEEMPTLTAMPAPAARPAPRPAAPAPFSAPD